MSVLSGHVGYFALAEEGVFCVSILCIHRSLGLRFMSDVNKIAFPHTLISFLCRAIHDTSFHHRACALRKSSALDNITISSPL
jgi:hypothetical protein